ncbi:hypothetical protein Bpfe_029439, partial [Biomphalaria pfeifferi]
EGRGVPRSKYLQMQAPVRKQSTFSLSDHAQYIRVRRGRRGALSLSPLKVLNSPLSRGKVLQQSFQ